MDVTPEELRTVELREAWRGYRPDDVDALLERVAATIEHLHAQVERLGERLARAEEEAGMGREADEMLRRTLLLAQRTADTAVSEAQDRARRVVAESEARASAIVAEAEAEARREAAGERRRLEAEITELAGRRDLLRADVDALERIGDDHRRALREHFDAQIAALDSRPDPALAPAPNLHEVELPDETTPEDQPSSPGFEEPTRALALDELEAELMAEAERAAAPAAGEVAAAASAGSVGGVPPPGADLLPRREDEPGDAPVDHDLDDESFFRELKAAVEDGSPLGPREDDDAWLEWAAPEGALFDQDADDEKGRLRSMFRRRD